jgi:hypothetical protein
MSSTNTYTEQKYCVYHITYSGDKLSPKNNSNIIPSNYIGSSTIDSIKSGYMGSIKSKIYKNIWKSELKTNPHLFSIEIISYHETRPSATYKELQIQKIFNVVKNPLFVNMAYAAPNGFFGRDVSGEKHPNYNKPRTNDSKEKISKNHANVSGKNNPMSNKIRITNGILNSTVKHKNEIPDGWYTGLTFNTQRKKETNPRKAYKKENKNRSTKGIKRKKFICIIETKKEYDKAKAKIYFPELPY